MSDLQVDVVTIEKIEKHPNADKLEVCTVKGWEVISGIGNYKVGDVVVHIPPDSLVPDKWAKEWEVEKYLSWSNKTPEMGRVKVARLRGLPSYGFLVPNDSDAGLGVDLKEHYGIIKWEPPVRGGGNNAGPQGQPCKHHPLFTKYTDIQNIRNYKNVFQDGEMVFVTEKIHGSNDRVGVVLRDFPGIRGKLLWIWTFLCSIFTSSMIWYEWVTGSHNVQRDPDNAGIYGTPLDDHGSEIEALIKHLVTLRMPKSIVIYGEIFGKSIQDLKYDSPDKILFRAFDIKVNDEYLDTTEFINLCKQYDVPHVPVLYRGPFSMEIMDNLYVGKTTLGENHVREGIVIKPIEERYDHKCGRVVLKHINPQYLLRKDGSEFH